MRFWKQAGIREASAIVGGCGPAHSDVLFNMLSHGAGEGGRDCELYNLTGKAGKGLWESLRLAFPTVLRKFCLVLKEDGS